MREVSVAASQMACSWDREANIDRACELVAQAAGQGANIVLIQELFEAPYFCIEQRESHFALASERESNPLLQRCQQLAKELGVVLPVSWFEKAGKAFFNSLCMIDADGSILGFYRKSHIPNGPGYQEKQYFTPGDTGFKVWDTSFGKVGVGICWDQWFPEAARCMALNGAELLFYPTAIGSEPQDPTLDSRDHWRRVMQGHAGANVMPVIASNRIGVEMAIGNEALRNTFYGNSFITDHTGAIRQQADDHTETVLVETFDLDAIADYRAAWGVFRDRRPELYTDITTHSPGVR